MSKTTSIIGLVVLVAFVVGFAISRRADNPQTNAKTSQTTAVDANKVVVDLSGQQLTELPDSILGRTDITTLNLSNNQFVSIGPEISTLTNLRVLNIENNRLESFPMELNQLNKLREVLANNNRLASLPQAFNGMSQLTLIDVSGNNIPSEQINQLRSQLINTEIKM